MNEKNLIINKYITDSKYIENDNISNSFIKNPLVTIIKILFNPKIS